MFSRAFDDAYQIFFSVLNLCVPKEDDQGSDTGPAIEYLAWDKVIDQERHHLRKTLEMFTDKATFVSANIVSIETGCIEAIGVNGAQSSLENRHRMSLF